MGHYACLQLHPGFCCLYSMVQIHFHEPLPWEMSLQAAQCAPHLALPRLLKSPTLRLCNINPTEFKCTNETLAPLLREACDPL